MIYSEMLHIIISNHHCESSLKCLFIIFFLKTVMLQRRKLDAVYYYQRSLAASNPILTARESLMSLFDEVRRKVSSCNLGHF